MKEWWLNEAWWQLVYHCAFYAFGVGLLVGAMVGGVVVAALMLGALRRKAE